MLLRLGVFHLVCILFVVVDAASSSNRLADIRSYKQLSNMCMLGRLHKPNPGPEPDLTGPCSGYSNWSCCSAEVGSRLSSDDEFAQAAFRMDHCGKRLSAQCEKWFERSRCLYECSPDLGPWLVKVSGYSWRTERAYGVPLCQSQCRSWYAACSADLSCVPNWSRNFRWIRKPNSSRFVNICPDGGLSMCRPLAQLHDNNANSFCETVWDGEFKVVADSQPCFKLNWDASAGNPNSVVALEASMELFGSSSEALRLPNTACLTGAALMLLLLLAA